MQLLTVHSQSGHRISFVMHDFVIIYTELGRIDTMFVHELDRKKRFFALLQLVDTEEKRRDTVLGADFRTFKNETAIVGLFGFLSRKKYVIHVKHDGGTTDENL